MSSGNNGVGASKVKGSEKQFDSVQFLENSSSFSVAQEPGLRSTISIKPDMARRGSVKPDRAQQGLVGPTERSGVRHL